jgi:hypothetical protein
MPVVKSSERAHQFVPEPFAVDVDPALALAVGIPLVMPKVAVVTEPPVAAVPMPDNEFAAATTNLIRADIRAATTNLIRADIRADIRAGVHSHVGPVERFGDVTGRFGALLLLPRIRWSRDRDSEPKRGKNGKNEGNFLQHFDASSRVLGRYLFPKPAARLRAARVPEQAHGLTLSEE